jgi:hypothetical protein
LLSLESVAFDKNDETLVPEAGSCTNCPKRTGFNTLLFDVALQDSCTDERVGRRVRFPELLGPFSFTPLKLGSRAGYLRLSFDVIPRSGILTAQVAI